MKTFTRVKGSTRTSKPVPVKFYPNFAGQDGLPELILETIPEGTEKPRYIYIVPESLDDVKQIMSHAHIVHHNFEETK